MKRDPTLDPSRPDAALGRAVRTSAIMLAILGLLAGGVFWFTKLQSGSTNASGLTENLASSNIPNAPFHDITHEAGIDFVHVNGAQGEKLLPETMGGGVAFFDADQDSDQDLLFVNGMHWPWTDPDDRPSVPATMALYLNDGSGRFENATSGSGMDVSLYGMGAATGDFDNDGRVDVFITAVGTNRLFRNEGGGRFRDVTETAGVAGAPDAWSTSCAFADIDRDGDLDLFVCNYVRWSREIDLEADYQLPGIGRAYGPPMNFSGTFPYLYRNEGQGRFKDISDSSGIQITHRATGQPLAKSLGVAPVDIDQDGWIDLVVANDTVQNFVFRNRRDGTFEEIGSKSGIAFDSFGQTRGAMGIDAARLRNDRSLGIAIGNFANEMNALYVSQAEGDRLLFSDEAIAAGVGPASQHLLKFGLFFFDYDLDGRLDVLTANGHLEEEIHRFRSDQTYRQPAQLFWNRGLANGVGFLPVPEAKCGGDLFEPMVGRGSAYADIDGDGDLDVVLTQIGGPPRLLRNQQSLGRHWVRLKLAGRRDNRDAIGTWVRLHGNGRILSRQVMPARGYLSQSELPITFGLDREAKPERVEVLWPDGTIQRLPAPPVNRLTVVEQSP